MGSKALDLKSKVKERALVKISVLTENKERHAPNMLEVKVAIR